MFHVEQRLNFRIICRKKRDRQFRLEKPVSFLLLDQTRAENPAGQMFGVRSQMNGSAVFTLVGVTTRSTDHSKSISVIPNFSVVTLTVPSEPSTASQLEIIITRSFDIRL